MQQLLHLLRTLPSLQLRPSLVLLLLIHLLRALIGWSSHQEGAGMDMRISDCSYTFSRPFYGCLMTKVEKKWNKASSS
ncbi:hypothetical protein SEVIR_2G201450v4 [Setaria viridis]|uniref:Secreted protein n=1 Tax=Setaria viridis TaxID=4556 RepID=A0A4V6DBE8_SETVI|nr:hypothetical protein SEVIR_2G201450v2 [Setaria viridis]